MLTLLFVTEELENIWKNPSRIYRRDTPTSVETAKKKKMSALITFGTLEARNSPSQNASPNIKTELNLSVHNTK